MIWEETHEIEATDHIEDHAPETRPPNETRFSHTFRVGTFPRTDRTGACEHYERRIRQGALDDWLQAEQEILGQQNTRNADRPHRGGSASKEQDGQTITQATSDTIKGQIVAWQTNHCNTIKCPTRHLRPQSHPTY
jgi:hypothetical protein